MTNQSTELSVFPFANEETEREAVQGMTLEIVERVNSHRDQMIASQNILKYRHGRTWSGPRAPYADSEGKFTEHSSVMETSFEEILKGDLSIVEKAIHEIANAMSKSFSETMFSALDKATEKTGNIVNDSGKKTFPEILIEVYSKIKFSVDRDGNISLPTLVAPPTQQEKWEKEMAAMSDDSAQKIKALIGQRTQEAIIEEQARLARFESLADESE
jgi:hypothetical protein